MKRFIALLLAFVMCFALLCSCAKKEQAQTPPPATDTQDKNEQADDKKEEEKVDKIYVDYSEKHKDNLYDIKDKIKINGRCLFDEEKGILAAWPNSGIEFAGWFDGNIRLYFTSSVYVPVPYYIVVDGDYENAKNVELTPQKTYVSLASVEKGYHTIGIYKADSANTNSSMYLTEIEYKGKLDEEPLPKSMKIEVLGDSISCGIGLVSPKYDDDAYYSYGAIAARNLNADLSIVAVGGWGIACGVKSFENVIPRIFDLTCYFADKEQKWDFENNQVDAVIVNLGTNDYLEYANKEDRSELHNALRNFFDAIRKAYPDARIYMTYGMMNTAFKEDFKNIIAERGDEKLEFVETFFNGGGIGNHPDAEAHVKYAKIFEDKIRADFGITDRAGEIGKIIREKNKLVTTTAPETK